MKLKHFLLSSLVAITLLSACSSENDDITPIQKDPAAKYVDYATYTAKSMGYEGDVNIVEKTIFEKSYINLADNTIEDAISRKEKYYFDSNGALVKSIYYSNNNLTDYNETSYTYDSLYRQTELLQCYYPSLQKYIIKIEYSSKDNTATAIYYKSDNELAGLDLQSKYVYKLDKNGRIDKADVDFYDAFYLDTELTTQKSTVQQRTSNYTLKVERDSKNNILNTYIIDADPNNNDKATVMSRYEQTIIYYDGGVSSPQNKLKNDFFSPVYIKTCKNQGFTGKVKSAISQNYNSTTANPIIVDNNTNKLSGGELSSRVEYKFDKNGNANEWNYDAYSKFDIKENGELIHSQYDIIASNFNKYEYDTQNRIKTFFYKTVSYDYMYNYYNVTYAFSHPVITTTSVKSAYTYDDVNNIVTEEVYFLENNNVQATSYNKDTEKDVETRGYSFNSTPTSNQKTVTKRDNAGNIILSYYIDTDYSSSGLISDPKITSYKTTDITYN